MIKGFKDFVMRGNVLDLAVGIVVGVAFGAVISSLVDDVLNPIIAAIFGKPDLSSVLTWTVNDAGTADLADDTVLSFGAFLTTVVNFLLVALAIYFAVVVPVNRLAARRAAKAAPAVEEPTAPTEIELLTEIRDALKNG